ncbi:3-oxoacyl-[acyl-carrier-protein] synthase III C-terminal domain-containing protein [Microcoleus sp. AR_TQ3_B6]|uniref:3-oxoacyl-[acyl-carrier-protein] synthase III C-terminal domain-containing protein n=1 Tax=Microcoleus sp. AR_TQ3_B6 TaxID=3055284 RepID=UPI002FD25ABD
MKTVRNNVFLGATQYVGGASVTLENLIVDPARCAALRNVAEGVSLVPVYEGEILEQAQLAVVQSLKAAGRSAGEIDAVFFVSNGLDAKNTLDAEWLGAFSERLGLDLSAHYRIAMAGCAGFHWAAKLASTLIVAEEYANVLLLSFDQAKHPLQRIYGEEGSFPYVTGDASSACILSASSKGMDFRLMGRVINIWDGKQARAASLEDEVGCIERLFGEVYSNIAINANDIDLMITNNYSLNVSRLYGNLAGIDFKKVYTETIVTHAHCFSSDIVINLHHGQRTGQIETGARVLTFSAGPYQWGACVFEKIEQTQG